MATTRRQPARPPANSRLSGEEDSESGEEEVVCRICRVEGEEGWPLFHPCKCSGSIKYVHQDCLQMWMGHSGITVCELCKHPFVFTPIYAPDAPTVLPSYEFAAGLIARASSNAHFLARLALVLFVWLIVIPVGTCWISRFLFIRALVDIPRIGQAFQLPSIPTDCVYGSFMSIGIVLMFLGIASLRDFVRQNEEEQAAAERWAAEDMRARNAELAGAAEPPHADEAPHDEAHGEHQLDDVGLGGFLDANDGPEVPFDELVGMNGPLQNLVENVLTVLASNAVFLALFCFVPFTVGRAILLVDWKAVAPSALAAQFAVSPNIETGMEQYGDQTTVAIGYVVIFMGCTGWTLLTVSLRSRFPGLQNPFTALVMAGVLQVYVFIKVIFLLFVELGVFPFICGVWLDICTLNLVAESSFNARYLFFVSAPITFALCHWLIGIIYMLFISLFVSLLREVMRGEIFWFLRNPDDPNYHPFRDLVEDSLFKHARRVIMSAMIYAPLIVLLVWTPVQLLTLCRIGKASVLPLHVDFSNPYTEVPLDIILFHVFLPFTLDNFHCRDNIKRFIRSWSVQFGGLLHMTHFIIPPEQLTADEWETLGIAGLRNVTGPGTLSEPEPEPEPEPLQPASIMRPSHLVLRPLGASSTH